MKMNERERVIIQSLQRRLRQGDIKKISQATGYSREYVGRCFNILYDCYNQNIIDAAIKVTNEREKATAKFFKALSL